MSLRAKVLTVSDGVIAGTRDDKSGAALVERLSAAGYEPAGISSYEKAPYLDWSNKTGNGSLYSTIDDLYLFDRALNTMSHGLVMLGPDGRVANYPLMTPIPGVKTAR